jgi:glycosyltransferase involved in cell wall biosynthesis
VRLAIYTDYEYRSDGSRRYGQRAFVIFLEAVGRGAERLVLVGRLDPRPGSSHYPLGAETELLGLPHYESLAHPWAVARSLLVSLGRFWRLLDDVDTAWVLGPYPHSVAFALITMLRRRRLVLGVRQDTSAYVRSRRPDRRWMHLGAEMLEAIWKLLARRHAIVVVGPELERKYASARRLLTTAVSLMPERNLLTPKDVAERSYDGELTVLTVGRIDEEKNPLLLAEILRQLVNGARRWRLVICGDGPLSDTLRARLAELGVLDHVELRGYVPIVGDLLELYRSSHVFLHVSRTEGFPQVLVEAFASCVPSVATAVGGVAAAAEGAALLVPPDDAVAAAAAVERIASDPPLRRRLIEEANRRARAATLEATSGRVGRFLEEAAS